MSETGGSAETDSQAGSASQAGFAGQACPGGSAGPLSLELLADLHAGVLDEQVAAQLRAQLAADCHAQTVLAALDATVAELSALPQQRAPRVPDAVSTRLDAALAAEVERSGSAHAARPPAGWAAAGWSGSCVPTDPQISSAPTADPSAPGAELATRRHPRAERARRARSGRMGAGWANSGLAGVGWAGVGVLAAAAAGLAVALSGVPWDSAGTPRAKDALGTATGVHSSEPMALTRSTLGKALDPALDARDFGPLSAPGMLQNCLAANDVAASTADPLGAVEVTLDGQPGVLVVLPTDRSAQFRLLVVGPNCSPGNPSQMANSVVIR